MPYRGRAPDQNVPGTRPVPAQLGIQELDDGIVQLTSCAVLDEGGETIVGRHHINFP